ncbi:MAG TPA: endolytic transglycosylase MltG [Candidatus Limnocylindria bacterium]|nr:endolytic transglycosylase MltG [Candidatus Limnocylindria bacterium]
MYDPRETPWERSERRSARIRHLREQREGPFRRRRTFEPIILLAWIAGVAALAGIALFVGFLAFAPRLMAWVEENPGSIEHGIVRDFVNWYRPEALADEPASTERRRTTIDVRPGMTDAQIGELLAAEGLVSSELAFQVAVLEAERQGTLAFGVYDLSPTLRPSEIVAALRAQEIRTVVVTIREGLRLEEIAASLAETDLTMNIEEFTTLVRNPPADLLNQYDFFADLPRGRSLEGYLYPDTYELDVSWTERQVVETLLGRFAQKLTPEIREAIAAQRLTVDQAVTLASIVEREAVIEEERPLIAAVYINRVRAPDGETAGLLNADPTLQYGQATFEYLITQQLPVTEWGSVEWWPELQVTGGDVGGDWPEELHGYQTYLRPGLPPSPIAAPRDTSLAAVAAPQGDNLYFVAGCPNGQRDGSHYFARTLGDHEANIARANEECAGG